MENQGQMQQYQAVSKLYKEIVDALTTLEYGQMKLYFSNLAKRVQQKQEAVLQEYSSVKELLNSLKEAKGKVALHFACAKGDPAVVQHLIEGLGVDFRVKDKEGNIPFFTAIEHGHLELVKYFVQEGKCAATESKEGQIGTLHIAANNNHTELMEYLISKGADIEKISIYGKPINWAVGSGSEQATKLLLEKGANPDGDSSASSVAPLIIAVDTNNQTIYKYLLDKGANFKVKDPNGYSILHLAAQKGLLHFVKDLVERGADIKEEVQGKNPLYMAFEHGRWEVVNYLKDKMPDHQQVQEKWKEQAEKMRASKVEPNKQRAEEIKNIGNKYYAAKQYKEALDEYMKALAFDQDNDVIHRNTAACYLALNQYSQALFHCKEARKTNPKNIKTVYREAQAYIGLNNLVDASSSMWECCMIEPANQMFRLEFQKLVEQAKKQHKESQ